MVMATKMKQAGVYHVNNTQFTNKVKALLYATENGIPRNSIRWDYYDDHFSKYDWTTEPPETLSYYYTTRCKQLRDTYDYLVLYYSGGSDSHNILAHFLKNNIFVDEIITSYPVEYYEKKQGANQSRDTSQMQNEWYYVTKKDLVMVQRLSPKTKITIHDYTNSILDFSVNEDTWVMESGESLQPSIVPYVDRLYLPHLKKLRETKKVGHIYGLDKPRVFIADGKWYFSFLDVVTSLQAPINSQEMGHEDVHIEKFYWAPESAQMLIKQAHVVKNFYQINSNLQFLALRESMTYQRRTMIEEIVRSIIYPYWRTGIFQVGKPQSVFMLEMDKMFFTDDDAVSSKAFGKWKEGYSYILNNINEDFINVNPETNNPDSFSVFWSTWHELGP